MRSRHISFRVPFPLYDALDALCVERGYKSISRLMIANCIIAIQNERRRIWVREIANASPKQQDYLIDKMLTFPTDMPAMLKLLGKLNNK